MPYRHLFGPVFSRRLGLSLGLDLVPAKTCPLDCRYCECGRTTEHTLERREYVPLDEVLEDLRHFAAHHPRPQAATFSGPGEPTLHARLGEAVRAAREILAPTPAVVLTNGMLLPQAAVREDLLAADRVIVSLNAVSRAAFAHINRPIPGLEPSAVIAGLEDFRRLYQGWLDVAVFIVPGVNDTEAELALLREAILRVGPDGVQLNSLDRPGSDAGLLAATAGEMARARDLLALPNARIVTRPEPRQGRDLPAEEREAALLRTLRGRPCTPAELAAVTGRPREEVVGILAEMEKRGAVQAFREERGVFYRPAFPVRRGGTA